MNQEKIGKFIAERRKKKGLTQVELAERLGVSNRSVSKWETGRCLPDYSLFQDLCELLDITINELMSGEVITKDEYQKRLEDNIVKTIDYNNKSRNKKMRRLLTWIGVFVFLFVLYKIFIVYFYFSDYEETDFKTYPYNQEISTISIQSNAFSNQVFQEIEIYIPDEFSLVTDKAKSSLVMDRCAFYAKDLSGYNEWDAAILICEGEEGVPYNLDRYGLSNKLFPYLNVYRLLEKYGIEDDIDLIQYYGKNYQNKGNFFSRSDDVKMNYIARNYVRFSLPSYQHFYFLESDLRGYMIENQGVGGLHQQARVYFKQNAYLSSSYDISFWNQNEEYFYHDNAIEIVSSITRR